MNQSIATRRRSITGCYAPIAYLVFFSVGTVGHYLEVTRPFMLELTPWFLLLFGLSALLPDILSGNFRVIYWATGTYVITFALEAIGVATGAVFGGYRYGPTLGLSVVEVPLIIGFNWVLVVFGSILLVQLVVDRVTKANPDGVAGKLRPPSAPQLPDDSEASGDLSVLSSSGVRRKIPLILKAIAVGILAVAFDFILEPVAIRFDYWQWDAVVVPVQNYAAWFIIATLVSIPFFLGKLGSATRLPIVYFAVQAVFIATLLPLAF